MKTGQINHKNLLWHSPDSNYTDLKLPYISGHQPLWYNHVTQVDDMDNQVPFISCNIIKHTTIKTTNCK